MKRILPIVLSIVMLFSTCAFASSSNVSGPRGVGSPTLTASGNTATCGCRITFSGQEIDATMELWQGSTLVASWQDTGTGRVDFYETVTIVRGLTYTLTVSGTVDGISFTPRSITKTL